METKGIVIFYIIFTLDETVCVLEVMGNFWDVPCQVKGFWVETTKLREVLK